MDEALILEGTYALSTAFQMCPLIFEHHIIISIGKQIGHFSTKTQASTL